MNNETMKHQHSTRLYSLLLLLLRDVSVWSGLFSVVALLLLLFRIYSFPDVCKLLRSCPKPFKSGKSATVRGRVQSITEEQRPRQRRFHGALLVSGYQKEGFAFNLAVDLACSWDSQTSFVRGTSNSKQDSHLCSLFV